MTEIILVFTVLVPVCALADGQHMVHVKAYIYIHIYIYTYIFFIYVTHVNIWVVSIWFHFVVGDVVVVLRVGCC